MRKNFLLAILCLNCFAPPKSLSDPDALTAQALEPADATRLREMERKREELTYIGEREIDVFFSELGLNEEEEFFPDRLQMTLDSLLTNSRWVHGSAINRAEPALMKILEIDPDELPISLQELGSRVGTPVVESFMTSDVDWDDTSSVDAQKKSAKAILNILRTLATAVLSHLPDSAAP